MSAKSDNDEGVALLTEREKEVTRLLAKGLGYKMIADELKISPRTVNTHLANVRHKLHAHSATELLSKLYRLSDL